MGNEQITKWFSGKALATVRGYVLPTLALAEAQGFWPKGASRKVRAALNKCNVAHKYARKFEAEHGESRYGSVRYSGPAYAWVHAMTFGIFGHAAELAARADSESAATAEMREWARDFAPIDELVELLDASRPKPVFVCKTLSRTVLANLGSLMKVDLEGIQMPEIVYEWAMQLLPDGTKVRVSVPRILWPEGTRHNMSKFAMGTNFNHQCHACGHAIKNAFNWVPLLAQTPRGPISLWVGRDCAKKLFDCVVDGDADWAAARKAA